MTSDTVKITSTGKWVPWAIVLFFVVQTIFFSWLAHVAQKTHTGMVTDHAYEKGLAYNDTIAKSEEQEKLGYTSEIEYKNSRIVFSLKDKNKQTIPNAKVKLWLYRPAHAGKDMAQAMTVNPDGSYAATIVPPEKGLWEIRIHAETTQGSYQSSKRIVIE